MGLVQGQLNLTVTVWGQEQAEARALKNVSRILSPRGDSADVFEWVLLGFHSVQYFIKSQMHQLVCNPVFQFRIPTKEGNEVKVSIQVPWTPLPLHSMPINHDFNHLNWHQTQPVTSLLARLYFSKLLRSYDLGWSVLPVDSLIPPRCLLPQLGGSRHSDQFMFFQTCSSLSSDCLASPMFVLPFAVRDLFSLIEKREAHEEGVRSPFAQCHF